MIEHATKMLQVAIDKEWEQLKPMLMRQALSGETHLYIWSTGETSRIKRELLSCQLFIEQLLDAGYDITIKKENNWPVSITISWKKALPGRKGEFIEKT